jgi:hypothetical protein
VSARDKYDWRDDYLLCGVCKVLVIADGHSPDQCAAFRENRPGPRAQAFQGPVRESVPPEMTVRQRFVQHLTAVMAPTLRARAEAEKLLSAGPSKSKGRRGQ